MCDKQGVAAKSAGVTNYLAESAGHSIGSTRRRLVTQWGGSPSTAALDKTIARSRASMEKDHGVPTQFLTGYLGCLHEMATHKSTTTTITSSYGARFLAQKRGRTLKFGSNACSSRARSASSSPTMPPFWRFSG